MFRKNKLNATPKASGTAITRVKSKESKELVQQSEDRKELDSLLPNICSTADWTKNSAGDRSNPTGENKARPLFA
jgi:hypothetical protein